MPAPDLFTATEIVTFATTNLSTIASVVAIEAVAVSARYAQLAIGLVLVGQAYQE